MKDRIGERIKREADFMIKTKQTVRNTADVFGVSKSTLYKDVTERLSEIDPDRAVVIEGILKVHKDTRHINGGMATKMKYENRRMLAEANG